MVRFLMAAVAACALVANAQADYPDRPIRMVLPFAPGQGTDVATRVVMAEVQKQINQPIVIENRQGGSGMIAIQEVMKAAPDGYTVLGFASSFLANASLYKQLPYDLDRDFVPVTRMVGSAVVLVVNPSLPVHTLAELGDYVRKHPGELAYASGGNSTTMHLAGELYKSRSGLDLPHVPYRGDPAAINDLLGGQVKVAFVGVAAVLPHIRAGKLRPVAVTTPTRIETLPDVPTIAESGFPGYEMVSWLGYMVPAGTPPQVVAYLADQIQKATDKKALRDKLADIGVFVTPPLTPAEFRKYVNETGKQIADVIRTANIKAE